MVDQEPMLEDVPRTEVISGRRQKAQGSGKGAWVAGFFLLAVICGLGGYFGISELQAAKTNLAALKLKADDFQQRSAKLEVENAELEGKVSKLEAEKEEMAKDVEAKQEELDKLKGTYDELQEKMKAEIAKGDISLSQAAGKLRVDLVDKVLFDSGDAEISKRGEEILSRVGAVLAHVEDKQIQVSGHTDDAPISPKLAEKFPTNWELSAARAINVVRFLQDQANVPGKRLVATGYGPYQPIDTNASSTGRARNRRIEILLAPALKPTGKADLPVADAKAETTKAEEAKAKADPKAARGPAKPPVAAKPTLNGGKGGKK